MAQQLRTEPADKKKTLSGPRLLATLPIPYCSRGPEGRVRPCPRMRCLGKRGAENTHLQSFRTSLKSEFEMDIHLSFTSGQPLSDLTPPQQAAREGVEPRLDFCEVGIRLTHQTPIPSMWGWKT